MKILRVRIHNYGSFRGPHEFELTGRGLVLVLGDNRDEPKMSSNGSAKSTLFEALDWCDYGKVPKGDHADSVVNEFAGKDCWVEVDHEDDESRVFTVRRWRKVKKTSGLQLTVGGKDVSALDAAETQVAIEALLGMGRDVFHAAVFFAQTDMWNFADATDKDRIGILTKILQLDQIDEWLAQAKEKRRVNASQTDKAGLLVSGLQGRIDGLLAQDYAEKIRIWDRNQQAKIASKAREVFSAESQVRGGGSIPDVAKLDVELGRILAAKPQEPDLTEARNRVGALTKVHQDLLGELATVNANLSRVQSDVAEIRNTVEGTCGLCGQPVTAEHLARELAKLEPEVSRLSGLATVTTDRLAGAADHVSRARVTVEEGSAGYYAEMTGYNQRSQAAQAALSDARMVKSHSDNAQSVLLRAREDLAREKLTVNPYFEMARTNEEDLTTYRAEIDAARVQHANLLEADRYFGFWVDAFGPKGLKSYIVDTKLQQLSDAANHWIQLLTGGTVWVRFETQTLGRTSKTLSNKMNIRVFRWNTDGTVSERNYRSWSGGEKQRVSLGIDLGLAKLIAQRASKKYDLLIFDEVFKHLDQLGREAVVEALHELSKEKSSVFVIDHDQSFQGAFENKVLVRKEGGASKIIEEAGHAEEKPKAKTRRGNLRGSADTKNKRSRCKSATVSP